MFLPYILRVKSVTLSVAECYRLRCTIHIGRVTFFRYGIEKRLVFLFGIPSVIFTVLGASLVNYISSDILKNILGAFLILFAVVSLASPGFKFAAKKLNAVLGGGLSGFLAGLIGTGGVLRGAFLAAFGLEKEVYIATAAVIALAVDITRIPIYFAGEFLASQYYFYIPILLAVALAGSYVGRKIVNKIPPKIFRILVLVAIAAVGFKFLF